MGLGEGLMGCLLTCRTMTELNASAPLLPPKKVSVGKAPCDRQVRSSVDAGAGEVSLRGARDTKGGGPQWGDLRTSAAAVEPSVPVSGRGSSIVSGSVSSSSLE